MVAVVAGEALWLFGCDSGRKPAPETGAMDILRLAPVKASDPRAAACAVCHAAIAAQWADSYHAKSWVDPLFAVSTGQRTQAECLPCHAPEPILAKAWETQPQPPGEEDPMRRCAFAPDGYPVLREKFREDGVSCLTCHDTGSHDCPRLEAPERRETLRARLRDPLFCGACHNPTHWVVDEWKTSRAAALKTGCMDCHMPTKLMAPATGEPTRMVRSHAFHSWRYPAEILMALQTRVLLEGNRLELRLTNMAGHRIPGEVPDRALCIVAQAYDARDIRVLRESTLLARPPKRGPADAQDTRLKPDETRVFAYDVPASAVTLEAKCYFRPLPYLFEEQSVHFFDRRWRRNPGTGNWEEVPVPSAP